MKHIFDKKAINTAIERYSNHYINNIIESPLLSYEELLNTKAKTCGIYLVFDGNELVYIGKTNDIRKRLKDMVTYSRHSIHQTFLETEMREILNEYPGLNSKNRGLIKRIKNEKLIPEEEFKNYAGKTKQKIMKCKFIFYQTDNLIHKSNIEHFAIAVLSPTFNL